MRPEIRVALRPRIDEWLGRHPNVAPPPVYEKVKQRAAAEDWDDVVHAIGRTESLLADHIFNPQRDYALHDQEADKIFTYADEVLRIPIDGVSEDVNQKRRALAESLEKGSHCYCGEFHRRYPRKLNPKHIKALALMLHHESNPAYARGGWFKIPEFVGRMNPKDVARSVQNKNVETLLWWCFAERALDPLEGELVLVPDPDGWRSGAMSKGNPCRLTPAGRAFIRGKLAVPPKCYEYNSEPRFPEDGHVLTWQEMIDLRYRSVSRAHQRAEFYDFLGRYVPPEAAP